MQRHSNCLAAEPVAPAALYFACTWSLFETWGKCFHSFVSCVGQRVSGSSLLASACWSPLWLCGAVGLVLSSAVCGLPIGAGLEFPAEDAGAW